MKERTIQLKENKGITSGDVAIAIILVMLFVSLITTLFYNYYMSSTGKNRHAVATNCAIDVIEQTKKMNYDDITTQSVQALIEQMKNGLTIANGAVISIPKSYTVSATIEKYNETQGNTDKQDIIKKIMLKVEYTLGKKTETIEMSKLIKK